MKILFIWTRAPGLVFEEYNPRETIFRAIMSKILVFPKPLTFPVLAALTPKDYDVKIIEASPRDVDYSEKYDIVGITATTRYIKWAYEMADEFRKRGSYVVLGGWHASALPNEAKQHADTVIIGEAEETWPEFLKDFENKRPKPFYEQNRPVDPSLIPIPLNLYPGGPNLGVQATRGCPYHCKFCSITNQKFGNVFRKRPIEDVVKEIESIPGKIFNFHDNSLTIDPDYTKELFRAIKGLNKKFYAFGNINVLGKDDEFLKLASEAGCVGWLIGFESISQESLSIVGKRTNIVNEYTSSIKKIHDYGMIILGSFVFGFDCDTLETLKQTDEFVRSSEIDAPDIMILTPFPGTPLFDMLDKEGRILTKDWSKYDLETVVFKPKNMTPEELQNNAMTIYRRWHNLTNATRRVLRSIKLGSRAAIETTMQNMYARLLRYYNK